MRMTKFRSLSRPVRYLVFLMTSLQLKSYRRWKAGGERNPFARPDYSVKSTTRLEVVGEFNRCIARRDARRDCPIDCIGRNLRGAEKEMQSVPR